MAENFPNLGKKIDIQNQEVQRTSKKELKEVHTKTHYNQFVKSQKKYRILKEERKKVSYPI